LKNIESSRNSYNNNAFQTGKTTEKEPNTTTNMQNDEIAENEHLLNILQTDNEIPDDVDEKLNDKTKLIPAVLESAIETKNLHTIPLAASTQLPSSTTTLSTDHSKNNSINNAIINLISSPPKREGPKQSQTSVKIVYSEISTASSEASVDNASLFVRSPGSKSPPDTRVFSISEELTPPEIDRKAELLAEIILTEDGVKVDNLDLEKVEKRMKKDCPLQCGSSHSRLPTRKSNNKDTTM